MCDRAHTQIAHTFVIWVHENFRVGIGAAPFREAKAPPTFLTQTKNTHISPPCTRDAPQSAGRFDVRLEQGNSGRLRRAPGGRRKSAVRASPRGRSRSGSRSLAGPVLLAARSNRASHPRSSGGFLPSRSDKPPRAKIRAPGAGLRPCALLPRGADRGRVRGLIQVFPPIAAQTQRCEHWSTAVLMGSHQPTHGGERMRQVRSHLTYANVMVDARSSLSFWAAPAPTPPTPSSATTSSTAR